MSRFQIQAIQEQSLPEVADFFVRWRKREEQSLAAQTNGDSNPQRIESAAYLRWFLAENPARDCGADLGYCIRDANGAFVGAILEFPSYFVGGGKRLKALCGGSFLVNAEAGIQASIMMKKHLNRAGHDFVFGTTCNSDAGVLLRKLRARPLANSEFMYLLPFRIERLLEAYAANRKFYPGLVAVLRAAGRTGSALVRATMKSAHSLRVAPCRDWEKLAALAGLHRNNEWITNERSAKFLEWRYGQTLATDQKELYCFCDKSGNEGWFAIGSGLAGRGRKILVTQLLDFVWPQEKVDPREIVLAVVAISAVTSDALYIRPRVGVPFEGFSRLLMRRSLGTPQCYVYAANGNEKLEPAQFDFVAADGDTWP
jgi:hypothetical protein